MLIGIPKECAAGETRVAATPTSVAQLQKLGFEVMVERGAGEAASFHDAAYAEAGARVGSAEEVWQQPIVFKVNAPTDAEIARLQQGATLVSYIQPAQNPQRLEALAARGTNVLAMDMVPRISRAQSLDALSSMANISGYRAVVEAAHEFGRFFTGQITAAGKVPPAKVLVIGAGVAGLAAIGTAVSLGAVVRAFDTRLEVAEQIQSMGGEFLKLDFGGEDGASSDGYAKVMSEEFIAAEMKLFAEQAKEVDIIITTAAIPGKPAPRLITADMVAAMKPGSVIVDLAAATGGNCELTRAGEIHRTENGVSIIGYTDLAARLPAQSSQLYATNLVNFAKLVCKQKDGQLALDQSDTVVRNMSVVTAGEITFPPPAISVSAAPAAQKAAPAAAAPKKAGVSKRTVLIGLGTLAVLFLLIGAFSPPAFLQHFMVFTLSCVVGYYVIWNVTHALHTPLMAVTNAISGIIVVGAILQTGSDSGWVIFFAFLATLVATINIVGGFTVTHRMLNMFRKDRG
ncbi:MAG: Re/Si-specific NAD(P)(+) transhydrogenase subunit alpha [Rhodocyclaceae bacterium]|nr:Re/Si-specific NAD(P)(+) transhydrogenase subunit alpha [Rhodocyclaceae bacterium]